MPRQRATAADGKVRARPGGIAGRPERGLRTLALGSERDGVLYVPPTYDETIASPLVLMLHGAGGTGRNGISPLLSLADERRLVLLAPESRWDTWDVIRGGYGPDVDFIDDALSAVFAQYNVDMSHFGIGGFSDGASYALSVGITNGRLFTHIIAFSPGFAAPADAEGTPRMYVSHGTRDAVLPIDRCSRRIVPQLQRSGYDVTYHEFDGPHTVPASIVEDAVSWFLTPSP